MLFERLFLTLRSLAALCVAAALILSIGTAMGLDVSGGPSDAVETVNPSFAILFLILFWALSLTALLAVPASWPRLLFLLALFPMLIGWRIAALVGLARIEWIGFGAFACFCAIFVLLALHGLYGQDQTGRCPKTTLAAIQLAFIRLYVGLDLVPHFTEKLFAGPATRADDISSFQALGVPDALSFVLLAGVIEFSAAIGVGLGLFTRLAAVCTVIYLMVATVMGHHFLLGFIWASQGGGWEYPVLWSALILSFVFGGGRWMSLDEIISEHVKLPKWADVLMGDTTSHTATHHRHRRYPAP